MVSLGEEVRRRLRNTDQPHSRTQVLEILRNFSQKLLDSDYDMASRQEILKSGVRKFYSEPDKATREGTSLYRTQTQMYEKKEIKALSNRP